MSLIARALLLLSLLSLTGCGFALRGSADLPDELRTLAVAAVDDNSDLLREVERALRNSDVTVLDEDEGAPYRLGLGRERSTERTLSVNSNARAGEYELTLSVLYQLSSGGVALLGPETLSISRVYLADPESATAKNEEEELILAEMRRELALQILRRLQTVSL